VLNFPDTGIFVEPVHGDGGSVFLNTEFKERNPRLSPDGRWMAYASNDSGIYEVYVRPYDGRTGTNSAPIRVSTTGADYPVWSRDGTELFFFGTDFKIYGVDARTLSRTQAIAAAPLFSACPETQPRVGELDGYPFDVGPDGRFLVLCHSGTETHVVRVNPRQE